MEEEIKIEVADHIIALNVDETLKKGFLEEIRRKYDLFLSPEGKPSISVDVELSADAPPEFFPLSKLTFKDNLVTIKDDCLLAKLDLSNRNGKVKLNPANPLYPLGTFLRNAFTLLVFLEDNGAALHAVGVLKDGEAFVFLGPSKAGKSTVGRLSSDKIVLSDDLILVKKVENEFKIFPTPCWGDKQIGPRRNTPYRINSMYKLIQDKSVYLESYSPARSLAEIFTIPHIPAEFIPQAKLLSTYSELISCVPYKGLHFLPDPSFWDCIDKRDTSQRDVSLNREEN